MKNTSKLFVLLFLTSFLSVSTWATTYYFHPAFGKDDNPGTSSLYPFKSLGKVAELNLQPGDAVLLAAGQTFHGSLVLNDVSGTAQEPIVIAGYQWGNSGGDQRAKIDAKGFANGVSLVNCRHIDISGLHIEADGGGVPATDATMRCGVLVMTSRPGLYEDLRLRDLHIENVFFEEAGFQRGKDEVRTANGTQRYGWGIRFINRTEGAVFKDLLVRNCTVKNVAHTGIKFTSRGQNIHDIKVYDNRVLQTGGPGIQMSGIRYGHIKNNYVRQSGSNDDSRKWGRGSGLWTWGSADVIIEHNRFLEANGPADSAGCHIDFNCNDVVVQYNFSAHNAGGFCEILGNNYNCAYRYNISVNDGHRVKGQGGAFQEGKTFWLSGYQGNKRPRKGPFNSYFYNNTIYVSKEITSKVAVSKVADGVLIANNIFYVEGPAEMVLGDQYVPESGGTADLKHIFFQNNLFLRGDNWPSDVWMQDSAPILGDPRFYQNGGLEPLDYFPTNTDLIRDKGIAIPKLPGDSIGLKIGLEAKYDMLGHPILNRPDLGAIELE